MLLETSEKYPVIESACRVERLSLWVLIMSHAKKNKGRDPEATHNDPQVNRLVTKFLELPETDFARNVVIPVLEAEGYFRIDFHHGNTEVGKDLIFFRDIGFDSRALVVAVVKSDRLSKTSSDSTGLLS